MKKEIVIIMDTELEQALKGFVPEFGNDIDLRISKLLTKLYTKLKTIDNAAFRKAQKDKAVLTAKMREIQGEEQNLIKMIISRNLDF